MKEQKSENPPQNTDNNYHTSVLLHESIQSLQLRADGVYVDATFGGGGHSAEMLRHLGDGGRLIAFDQDADAQRNKLHDRRFTFVEANFCEMKKFLRLHRAIPVQGILVDLGVSSWQFDTAERGFSYRYEGPLDMRMNRQGNQTAADVLNKYSALQLQTLLSEYGEVRNAKTLAQAIVEARLQKRFENIGDLLDLCETHRMGEKHKYFAQVFQALRIEVNGELDVLKDFLMQANEVLQPGGRLAVITFHSLEDRLVKQFMKYGDFGDEPTKDVYGRYEKKFRMLTKKPITASDEEQKHNSRSRSAKLRVAEKI